MLMTALRRPDHQSGATVGVVRSRPAPAAIRSVVAISVVAVVGWLAAHLTSPLVRRWRPSSFRRRTAGPLSVLDSGGPTDAVVVLLHGLGATGDYFGDFYDGLGRRARVVIPDLLGFGGSLDERRDDFGVDAHVDALDEMLEELGLGAAQVTVAAHSMSSAIAVNWATRHPDRAAGVHLWSPPVYPLGEAERSVGKEYGPMARIFALDSAWAERACRLNCANRALSGALMALVSPRWPIPISRSAALHTWASYHGSLRGLILDFDWTQVLPIGVVLTVHRGADDPIGDDDHLATLVGADAIVVVPDADHHVPLRRPDVLLDALR